MKKNYLKPSIERTQVSLHTGICSTPPIVEKPTENPTMIPSRKMYV